MARTTFSDPIENLTGKLSSRRSNGRVYVNRRKCFGYDAKGRPFYGPNETYVYHLHQGEWSQGTVNNRQLFRQAQLLAREELKNPERLAYWQPLFDKQFKRPQPNQKHYTTILGFVVAQLFAQLKSENQLQSSSDSQTDTPPSEIDTR